MADRVPVSLLAALADLAKWLESARIPAVIIGGVASSFLGRPRLTQDVDALAILPDSEWESAAAAAQNFGIVPRIEQAIDFARRSRVLLLKHTQSDITIDVILGGLPFEQEAVRRASTHRVGGISIRLPRVEDLVISAPGSDQLPRVPRRLSMPPFMMRLYGERALEFSLSQAQYFRYRSTNVDKWIEATLEDCGQARPFVGNNHS